MQCWSCSYTSWQWRLWRARRAECDWVGCGSSSTGVAAASVALPMKFSSVSRLLLHWPAHWHHRDPGTLLYWCWDTGHWSPHRPGPPPGAAATLPPPCWGWLGEARQCPLYPVSRSASRCGGGRCGVLRSIHYTVIGMQGRRWPGSNTAGYTAPTIPAASDTSFPFYMLCPLPLVTSSAAQGREKRWFILLSIAIETIFQYPWYMVDIRL